MKNAAVFQHRHASHCESGVMAGLVTHAGLPMSEAMAFGLASTLAFAYLPVVKVGGLPLVAFRAMPHAITRGLSRKLHLEMAVETFRNPEQGAARLDELVDQGELVGLQTSGFWLPYFPEDLRFHFNVHNLIVLGREGDEYLISDPVFETPVRCPKADLTKARFAKGLMAPKGRIYYPRAEVRPPQWDRLLPSAIRKTCRTMLAPVPFAGAKGIRSLARAVEKLKADDYAARLLGHVVRMQEEIGTGGGGFRFIYAAFLQEAASLLHNEAIERKADEMVSLGDHWREVALEAALMIRGRHALEPAKIAALLKQQADREETFFRGLRESL
ncbi:MAG: BtrH N-terminal domain-containing protein [Firmicutes bacterium]|nr:BtrH N-terminal domain-containing protein [Bacillota bacterium]